MTYLAQDLLAQDPDFQARVRSCSIQQAEQTYMGAGDPADAAYARAVVRGTGVEQTTMFALVSQSPGLAVKVDNGDGTVDSSKVSDEEVLAGVQAYWHDAASSYYSSDGTPLT